MASDPAGSPRIHAVGDVVAGVNRLLEDRVGRIWVVGEVSNLSRPRSGHVYFTLKDARGQLRAALFRNSARQIAFEPEEGLEVMAYGDLGVYEARGDLQLIVRQLEPCGRGALQLAFEQLRRKLDAEGLFEAERKRPLPAMPRRVGVVTSPTGAALRDVLAVARRRGPGQPLLLAPTRVQGLGAEYEIVEALERIVERPGVDVVLLVRGGGSLEDLQPFNTERVARAIAACPVPVVCGVGHETDTTIADGVADLRAATPSAATVCVIPDRTALAGDVETLWLRLLRASDQRVARARERLERREDALRARSPRARLAERRARLERARERLVVAGRSRQAAAQRRVERAARRLVASSPAAAVALARQRLDGLAQALDRIVRGELQGARHRAAALAARLDGLSPLKVLGRGYAIVSREDGAVVRRASEVEAGDAIGVRLSQGRLEARVERRRDAESD